MTLSDLYKNEKLLYIDLSSPKHLNLSRAEVWTTINRMLPQLIPIELLVHCNTCNETSDSESREAIKNTLLITQDSDKFNR